MPQRFDDDALAAFTVADALDRFGVRHARSRAACPLCQGSNEQAFAFGGPNGHRLWQCFSCGRRGNVAQLYAALAGVPVGRAIAEIASHLGLIPSTPSECDSRRAEAEAGRELDRAYADLERRRLNKLASDARRAEEWRGIAMRLAKAWGQTEMARDWLRAGYALGEAVEAWERHEERE